MGGLICYQTFIKALEALDIPIIAIEMGYVSMHIKPEVPSIQDHVRGYEELMDSYGFDKGIVIGHSWGSNVISWLCQCASTRVASSVFLDPVVFMLHLKDITHNWFYEDRYILDEGNLAMNNGKESLVSVASVISLIKTELFSVHALQRPYVWFRNILFPKEMDAKDFDTHIVVSSKDPIVPSTEIYEQITTYKQQTGT